MPEPLDEEEISFGLLQNALDYFLSASEHGLEGTPKDWKYALLHLEAGIELLLKACLASHDWKLIFTDINKANELAFSNGDFASVDMKIAIKRLRENCQIEIGDDVAQKLFLIRNSRNKVQHFAINVDKVQIVPQIAFGYHFCLEFIDAEISSELSDDERETIKQIALSLIDLEEFVATRSADIEAKVSAAKYAMVCPTCLQEAMTILDGPRCLFCFYEPTDEELAFEIAGGDPKDWWAKDCPECGGPCAQPSETPEWLCFRCGMTFEDYSCPECENIMSPGDGICESCMDYHMSQD